MLSNLKKGFTSYAIKLKTKRYASDNNEDDVIIIKIVEFKIIKVKEDAS